MQAEEKAQEVDLVDENIGSKVVGHLAAAEGADPATALPLTSAIDPQVSASSSPGFAPAAGAMTATAPAEAGWGADEAPPIPAGAAVVIETGAPIETPAPAVGQIVAGGEAVETELLSPPRSRPGHGRLRRVAGFALAFILGTTAGFAVVTAGAAAAFSAQSDRVVQGVHVGSVDLTGLTRDEAVARLTSSYAYLSQGQVTVVTPTGAATLTYQQLGRAANVQAMADAAMAVGHSGDPVVDAVDMLRTAITGRTIPVIVSIDPTAVATSVRHLASRNIVPQDARAEIQGGVFGLVPAVNGSALDENAIDDAIVSHLTQPDAAASFQAGGAFVTSKPSVSDADARAAIAGAQKMVVDVSLEFGAPGEPQASGSTASPAPTAATASPGLTFAIARNIVFSWIDFGYDSAGKYGPLANPSRIQAYLSGLTQQARIAPVEPTVSLGPSGPVISGGRSGWSIDTAATAQVLAGYLDGLALGGNTTPTIYAISAPVSPNITAASLAQMVDIGSWTTTFYPDISNGNGANIRQPAKVLNGQMVAPGQQFSFLGFVGPIDPAHGFALGGVIEDGKSNHTGAMGGGICSASTTMFNAAARAGLQIDARTAHYYYINRYPVGLDATVFSNGVSVTDLKWTNDTPNPILIIGTSTYGSKSTVTFQLWSQPTGRTVTFSPAFEANVVKAGDSTVYTTALAPGQENRAEYPTDGFDTSRTRTVTDSTGKVIHSDTWYSHYAKVDGLLQIGVSATPPPPATPPPATPPLATPTPSA
jgi:vancomycin resistance protein YoaR